MAATAEPPIVLLGSDTDVLVQLGQGLADSLGGSAVSAMDTSTHYHWPQVILLDNSMEDWQKMAETFQSKKAISIYVHTKQPKESDDELFVKNSLYEVIYTGNDDTEHILWELTRLVAHAKLPPPSLDGPTNNAQLTLGGPHTFFLSLSYDTITEDIPFADFCRDVDAMEYRVDLLKDREDRYQVLLGLQEIRRLCRDHTVRAPALSVGSIVLEDVMPIVYTVRTQHQAGTYPDDADGIQRMKQMLQWGLRSGVEILDVESAWEGMEQVLDVVETSYKSQILGSHHVVGETTDLITAVTYFQQCEMKGRAHGAKVVLSIDDEQYDRRAYEAGLIASELALKENRPVIPNISLILGDVGQFSRVINLPFTPVTHEALPTKAAPGQLTASEIMTTRLMTKIFEPMVYCILGHNIAYSVSPQMHGAAFSATKLPHRYVRADVETVEEFVEGELWKSADFGGTSVTIPHKQAIMKYVDVLSEAAKAIGSVNTIIAKDEFIDDNFKRVIYGDNTDWKGIYNPLHRLLGSTVDHEMDYCLILGAGGTARAAAYVAGKLGLKPLYFNRTPSKAQELADTFGGSVVDGLEEDGALNKILSTDDSNVRVVISTLPAASEFMLPEWILSRSKPVIFDVNYKPYYTKLLRQAESAGCSLVRGSEMLWEQGVGQFELWTGRTAPYRVMKSVVLENCQEELVAEKSFE